MMKEIDLGKKYRLKKERKARRLIIAACVVLILSLALYLNK